eukprot:4839954-Prymnesium_polylepis.1
MYNRVLDSTRDFIEVLTGRHAPRTALRSQGRTRAHTPTVHRAQPKQATAIASVRLHGSLDRAVKPLTAKLKRKTYYVLEHYDLCTA